MVPKTLMDLDHLYLVEELLDITSITNKALTTVVSNLLTSYLK